ncbi:MAG: lysylphosphatidylglycerol synthase transmembrane domain-containing protein [Dehalococcoidia bacterium]|nr:lysylphosphatidylglycerol synthase transmembrane domain-containing protein [Dehalococcoidia bacterium]
MTKKRVWLPILVSIVFLVWLFRGTSFQQMSAAFVNADYKWIVPAIGVYFVGVWFRAWRWEVLLSPLKRVSASRLFPIVVIGYMANDILPARLGELVKTYILGEKEGISKSSILATVAVERMFDGLALLSFMAVISLFVPLSGWIQSLVQLSALFFGGFLVVFLVVASSKGLTMGVVKVLLRLLPSRLCGKVEAVLDKFIEGLAALQSPWRLALIFVTSALAWLAEAAMYYLVMFSFDFRQSFPVLMLTTATANIGITIPSLPGGIGPFEVAARETLGFFGVDSDIATAYSIVLHAALLLPPVLLGIFYLWREGLSLGRIVRQQPTETGSNAELS